MARAVRQAQDNPKQVFSQDSFSGGINTATGADKIGETEAVDILNFEFDAEDQLISRSGTTRFLAPAFTYNGRITSIHYSEDDDGNVHVLFTNQDKLYRTSNTGTTPDDITSGLLFPTDTFWMWKNFTGLAIGVNQGDTAGSYDNPIKVDGATPDVAVLAGSPPKAKYIEVWNNRIWLVGADEPNTIYGSALGNPEDWSTTGAAGTVSIDISKNDGDRITGIIAFRERLFVFKRTKIFVVSAASIPVTDPDNLRVDIFSNNIGCVSAYSIKSVLDDVLFLSDSGVASLASSEAVGDFTSALMSRNVVDISKISKLSDEIPAIVMEEADQYMLGTTSDLSFTGVDEAFVLDYKQIQNRIVRWLRFDNKLVGSAYAPIYVNGEREILIGAKDGADYALFKYVPKLSNLFSDDNEAYLKQIKTRAFNARLPLYRKLFHRFGATIRTFQTNLNLTITYFFDQLITHSGSYTFNIDADLIGSLWDEALWDSGIWDASNEQVFRIWRKFKSNQWGRKGVDASFILSSNTVDQGLVVNNIQLEYAILSHRSARNV